METTAVRDGDDWVINGAKRFNSGMHEATHDGVFARTSGQPGDARGITAFITRPARPGSPPGRLGADDEKTVMEDFRSLGQRLSNWRRWDDPLGVK